ncbi:MAG: RnfABCDGE type electron transport complex subunit G [Lachnospiraceae bacterium]|nr:RnfABCDGE type electron transport complex subunit G [Lachnospiraceae bacterium]
MKEMFKNACILLAITLISGLVLGFVYDLTKEPIRVQQENKKNEAYKAVFADASEFEVISEKPDLDPADVTAYVAAKGYDASVDEILAALDANKNRIGYVLVITDHEGYGGDITFAMGITQEGILNGVSLLSISETAGLGMRAEEVLVPQMPGKDMNHEISFTKTGGAGENDVDAISGATITTTAFVNGINAGRTVFTELLLAGKGAV